MREELLRGLGACVVAAMLSGCATDKQGCDHLSPQVVKRYAELEFQAEAERNGQSGERPITWSPANVTYEDEDRPHWNVRWMERNDQSKLVEHTANFYCNGDVVLLGDPGGNPATYR